MGNAYNNVPCTPGTYGNPGTCTSTINTQYASINGRANGGISNYNALITRVITKNLWKTGITLDANYTWSHAIDNLSDTFSSSGNAYVLGFQDPFNPMGDRGNANFDIRHRMAISGIWNVPLFKGTSLRDIFLAAGNSRPIFTARTGSPYSLYDCTNGYEFCERAETPVRFAKASPMCLPPVSRITTSTTLSPPTDVSVRSLVQPEDWHQRFRPLSAQSAWPRYFLHTRQLEPRSGPLQEHEE